MNMPEDPIMLYSYINTLLRDKYSSLDELCRSRCVDVEMIKSKLGAVGFEYSSEYNKFI